MDCKSTLAVQIGNGEMQLDIHTDRVMVDVRQSAWTRVPGPIAGILHRADSAVVTGAGSVQHDAGAGSAETINLGDIITGLPLVKVLV